MEAKLVRLKELKEGPYRSEHTQPREDLFVLWITK